MERTSDTDEKGSELTVVPSSENPSPGAPPALEPVTRISLPSTPEELEIHLADLLEKTFAASLALFGSPYGFVGTLTGDRRLQIRNATGPYMHYLGQSVAPGRLLHEAMRLGEPVFINDIEDSEDNSDLILAAQKGAMAILPLQVGGRAIAVMGLVVPENEGRITADRMAALRGYHEITVRSLKSLWLNLDVKDRESELRGIRDQSEEIELFYRQFCENIRQCFWILELKSQRAVFVSSNFERVFGNPRSILEGSIGGFLTVVHPDDKDRVTSDFHVQLEHELDTEFRVVAGDGEIRWIWLRCFPTGEAAEGQSPRMVLIADDITEKKQQEEIYRRKEAQLAATSKMIALGELAGGVAHEINGPLTIIFGKAWELHRMIEQNAISADEIKEITQKIESTAHRIADVVHSLKSLARQDSLHMSKWVSFRSALREALDVCGERFANHGIELRLPELPEDFGAEMHATQISQLVLILLNNAFDAVEKLDERWVEVEYAEDKDNVYFYVTDSGPGIPIKIRSRIFEPFFTTKSPGKGTGLGLCLAQGIAAKHTGSLRIDTLHSHTRFALQLPKKQPRKF